MGIPLFSRLVLDSSAGMAGTTEPGAGTTEPGAGAAGEHKAEAARERTARKWARRAMVVRLEVL
jgi:hypothetical protein